MSVGTIIDRFTAGFCFYIRNIACWYGCRAVGRSYVVARRSRQVTAWMVRIRARRATEANAAL